jgi:phospholipase/lecithinase/hemolysin
MRSTAKINRGLAAVLIALFILPGVSAKQDTSYDSMYVFGDSLADNGNDFILTRSLGADPAVPPSVSPHRTYFNGRFSNGPNAFEYLWQLISGKAPGTPGGLQPILSLMGPGRALQGPGRAIDFAFGGTGTPFVDQTPGGLSAPGLKGQIDLYRSTQHGKNGWKRSLFVIVTGANDYRDDPFNQPMQPAEVVQNIADGVVALYQLGARDIMVLNLPDLGKIPANFGDATATALSNAHNALFAIAMSAVQAQYPQLNLMPIDINAAFGLLPANMNQQIPALSFLFPPGSLPSPPFPPNFPMALCLFINPATCVDAPLNDPSAQFFAFWDAVHPSTAAHRVLGQYLFDSLHP